MRIQQVGTYLYLCVAAYAYAFVLNHKTKHGTVIRRTALQRSRFVVHKISAGWLDRNATHYTAVESNYKLLLFPSHRRRGDTSKNSGATAMNDEEAIKSWIGEKPAFTCKWLCKWQMQQRCVLRVLRFVVVGQNVLIMKFHGEMSRSSRKLVKIITSRAPLRRYANKTGAGTLLGSRSVEALKHFRILYLLRCKLRDENKSGESRSDDMKLLTLMRQVIYGDEFFTFYRTWA